MDWTGEKEAEWRRINAERCVAHVEETARPEGHRCGSRGTLRDDGLYWCDDHWSVRSSRTVAGHKKG